MTSLVIIRLSQNWMEVQFYYWF